MFLAKVVKKVISTEKHKSFYGKTVFVVQPVLPDEKPSGDELIAMDYLGAGIGDIVICGGAPGVARTVFNLKVAPIRTLIVAIVDNINYNDPQKL
jgi:ethanolamine utilization protein EutN